VPRNSLVARLLTASVLVLPLFLGLTGYYLNKAFESSLRTSEAEKLKTQIYLLLAATELSDNNILVENNLPEPRFTQLDSGLYGYILINNKVQWKSPSSSLRKTPSFASSSLTSGESSFHRTLFNNSYHFAYSYTVIWEDDFGNENPLTFKVLHTEQPLLKELATYQATLFQGLGLVALLLIATQYLVMRWGLKPLRKLAVDVKNVESGKQDKLADSYPKEILPLTNNLNHLILNERNQSERYQNTLADLAHSLKTPLAVLKGAQDNLGFNQDVVQEQLGRMDEIITHQLKRASTQHSLFGIKPIAIEPIAKRLTNALSKVYMDKQINATISIPADTVIPMHESDVMELLGNLLDNAFKYGCKEVHISAQTSDKGTQICIDDDGAGFSKQQAGKLKQRGVRADEVKPGQGIGLAVTLDITNNYLGRLDFKTSELGGAKVVYTMQRKNT